MAKGVYIGVDSKARKVKRIYVGVNGIAKIVKKAYIGVGGKATLCFRRALQYKGADKAYLTDLRFDLATTNLGNLALFGGGDWLDWDHNGVQGSVSDEVDAFNASLTKSTAKEKLRYGGGALAAATAGNLAIFAGGKGFYTYSDYVDGYDIELTRFNAEQNLSDEKAFLAATAVGGWAIFAGGYDYDHYYKWSVEAYNASLSRLPLENLEKKRRCMAATTLGGYALFAGGFSSTTTAQKIVEAFNTSLTRSTLNDTLSIARGGLAATTLGNLALFGGGGTNTNYGSYPESIGTTYTRVDVCNTSLTISALTVGLSVARACLAATTLGDYAIFAGGITPGSYTDTKHAEVDVFDSSLTRTTPAVLKEKRYQLAAATVGDCALFGGGKLNLRYGTKVIDVFELY